MFRQLVDAVRENLGRPKRLDPKELICDLHIDVVGWRGPHEYFENFLRVAKAAILAGKFQGNFHVQRDGNLVEKYGPVGLHTYFGELDLNDLSRQDFSDSLEMRPFRYFGLPHIRITRDSPYFKKGEIFANAHPDSFVYDLNPRKLMAVPLSRPQHTLQGLYASTGENVEKRIEVLQTELQETRGFIDDGISLNPKTRLGLLERKYRELISDQ